MGTDQIMYCIVALILGMLLANMLKNVCGCNVVEGNTIPGDCIGQMGNLAEWSQKKKQCVCKGDSKIENGQCVCPYTDGDEGCVCKLPKWWPSGKCVNRDPNDSTVRVVRSTDTNKDVVAAHDSSSMYLPKGWGSQVCIDNDMAGDLNVCSLNCGYKNGYYNFSGVPYCNK